VVFLIALVEKDGRVTNGSTTALLARVGGD
jgi:hypothetical protein